MTTLRAGATCGKGFITPVAKGGGGGGGGGARTRVSLTSVEELPSIMRYMPRFALTYLLGTYTPKLFLGMVAKFKKHRKIE